MTLERLAHKLGLQNVTVSRQFRLACQPATVWVAVEADDGEDKFIFRRRTSSKVRREMRAWARARARMRTSQAGGAPTDTIAN